MKNLFVKAFAISAMALMVMSCTKNDDEVSGNGSLKVQFENGYANNELDLGTAMVPNSQNEVLKINSIKYIISNIVLTRTDGTTFTYPKSQSYFIVDESNASSLVLTLNTIPAGDYKSIRFGIGVDQAQYSAGQSAQGDFWSIAQAAAMASDWTSGYKYVSMLGTFTAPTATTPITADTAFVIQTAKSDSSYNFTEVSLDLPTNALVRTNITPQIHLSTDLSKIIDGTNKISLASKVVANIATITGADWGLITANMPSVFSVEHVHNDPN